MGLARQVGRHDLELALNKKVEAVLLVSWGTKEMKDVQQLYLSYIMYSYASKVMFNRQEPSTSQTDCTGCVNWNKFAGEASRTGKEPMSIQLDWQLSKSPS